MASCAALATPPVERPIDNRPQLTKLPYNRLKHMRPATVPKVRALQCPNCGGSIELRGYGQSINAVCIHCLSILDTRTPSLQVLQRFQMVDRRQPLIPLGTRGKLHGTLYEAIGFQVRAIEVDDEVYEWSEYLLMNPYKGYRYLTEYQGHWNDIRTLRAIPENTRSGRKKAVRWNGVLYKHFQSASARTEYVMGEFPWQVRVGDSVLAEDYIAPPGVISAENSSGEVVWSVGVYTPGETIWKAFSLQGKPPRPVGIYANQPSPYSGRVGGVWTVFFILLGLLFAGMIFNAVIAGRERELFSQRYSFDNSSRMEHSFVTPMFQISETRTDVEVEITTDLANDWAYFSLALINDNTGVAYDLGKEVSYYFGRDSDGAWTEGGRTGRARFPNVLKGNYYLRVEPDMEDDGRSHRMNYSITVRSGVASFGWFVVALFLLPVPAIVVSVRAFSFENRRWAESDYGAMISSSSSED